MNGDRVRAGSVRAERNTIRWSVHVGVALALFGAITSILLLYVLHFHRAEFTSDDSVVNLLAGEMFEQGRLLPHGWVTNNGDLMVPSGALLVAALLNWAPNGFGAHSISGVFAVVTLLGAFVWLMRLLRMPWIVVLLLAAFIGSGVSKHFAYFVFAQTTYLWWPLGFLLGAGLICRVGLATEAMPARVRSSSILLFFVVFAISFANPGRVFIMMVIPLYAFERILAFGGLATRRQQNWWQRPSELLGGDDPLVLGIGTGFLSALTIYLVLKWGGMIENVNGAAALHLNDWNGAWRDLRAFGTGWLPYLGAEQVVGQHGSPAATCLRTAGGAIAMWLTWVALSETWRVRNHGDPVRSAIAISFVAAFLPILTMYVAFGTLAADNATLRYFTVPVLILVVLAAFQLRDFTNAFPRASPRVLLAIGTILAFQAGSRFLPSELSGAPPQADSRSARAIRLAQALQREGLNWGYASWWNAGVTTVMADGAVRVSPVTLTSNGVSPAAAMVSHDWYQVERWPGETFLVLTSDEASAGRMDVLNGKLGPPSRQFDVAGYDVLVYDHNISMEFECPISARVDQPIAAGEPTLRLVSARLATADARIAPLAIVHLRNEGAFAVGGTGQYPISLGIQLLDVFGTVVKRDWLHVPLPCTLQPGEENDFKVVLARVPVGRWQARFDIVQEGVAWFQTRGMKPIDVPLPEIAPASEGELPKLDFESHP